jgi:hypothetical protein
VSSVTVLGDQTVEVPLIELASDPGSAQGTFTLEGATVHWGILVSLVGTDFEAVTDASGAFSIAGVLPGTYLTQPGENRALRLRGAAARAG